MQQSGFPSRLFTAVHVHLCPPALTSWETKVTKLQGFGYTETRFVSGLLAALALLAVLATTVITPLLQAAQPPHIAGAALLYSTYLGGGLGGVATAVGVDGGGNVYVAGLSYSRNIGPGPLSTIPSREHAFVVKLSPDGRHILYTAYLPASTIAMAVDRAGNAYLTGATHDAGFPVHHAPRPKISGFCYSWVPCEDAFVTKLDSRGRIVYSTFLGGSCEDWGNGIAVDSMGNAYVTGATESTDFPTVRAAQAHYAGPYPAGRHHGCLASGAPPQPWGDAFVTKLNPSGNRIVYSTFLGGPGNDGGAAIAVDGRGNAYVAGKAGFGGFPILHGLPTGKAAIPPHIFVTELDPGGKFVFSTYLGGSRYSGATAAATSIAVGRRGDIYLAGYAGSASLPTFRAVERGRGNRMCPDPVEGSFPCTDAFVAKLSPARPRLLYSTYLGGDRDDGGYGLTVDSAGNAYVVGSTQSPDFPVRDASQPHYYGGWCGHAPCTDAFVTKLNRSGEPQFSTFLGSGDNGNDLADAVAVHGPSVWVVGRAGSSTFPTVHPLQRTAAALPAAFAAQFRIPPYTPGPRKSR